MELYAGLMSGTSLDGVDVAVVGFGGGEERPSGFDLVAFRSFPYEPEFRDRLRAACGDAGAAELCRLDFELGHRFAEATLHVLEERGIAPRDIVAVGCHGQTVWHQPPDGTPGGTLQIGEPAVLAEAMGVPVVADFRVRDMAAGGHGAPLTAYFDRLLLSSASAARAIQNLGGMGNVTALPVPGSGRPLAFDTGPGVVLIDACVRRISGGRASWDVDGELASRGTVCESALAEWMKDPFFRAPPPRSTGRERFSEARLQRWMRRHADLDAEDLVATLTELTARSVEDGYGCIGFALDEVYLCGGGARNPELVRRIRARLAPLPVDRLEALGWDGEAREAAAFALLARQHRLGLPLDLGWATGAAGPRILGKWVPA
ncbi:MAG: anhydro-N-acetylmuramic acid kinase [Gemmatimonadota bacterium]